MQPHNPARIEKEEKTPAHAERWNPMRDPTPSSSGWRMSRIRKAKCSIRSQLLSSVILLTRISAPDSREMKRRLDFCEVPPLPLFHRRFRYSGSNCRGRGGNLHVGLQELPIRQFIHAQLGGRGADGVFDSWGPRPETFASNSAMGGSSGLAAVVVSFTFMVRSPISASE